MVSERVYDLPVLCDHANMAETHSDTISSTRGDTRQPVLQPQNQVDRNTHRFNHPIVTAPQLNRIEISLPETSRLDGAQNYQIWSLRVKRILVRYRVWQFCVTPRSRIMTEEELEGKELARDIMLESVKDSVATIVERFADPYECWLYLSNRYKPKGGSRRLILLLRRLVYSRKEDSFSMEQHLKTFKENWDQLQRINVPISVNSRNSTEFKQKVICLLSMRLKPDC
jgi:hypothetical protein